MNDQVMSGTETVCRDCGAVMGDIERHAQWHEMFREIITAVKEQRARVLF